MMSYMVSSGLRIVLRKFYFKHFDYLDKEGLLLLYFME